MFKTSTLPGKCLGHDFLGGFHAHIAVVPRLVANTGEVLLVLRIAQDEPIFLAVFHQPLLFRSVLLLFLQNLYSDETMSTASPARVRCACRHHPAVGLCFRLFLGVPFCQQAVDLVLVQGCLVIPRCGRRSRSWGRALALPYLPASERGRLPPGSQTGRRTPGSGSTVKSWGRGLSLFTRRRYQGRSSGEREGSAVGVTVI